MIWFTWRQFRTPAWIAGGGLAVIAVLLAITGHNLADLWAGSGAATCHADCSSAFKTFADEVGSSINDIVYNAGLMVMYAVPALVGIFWGAPLIARELETGTHRLAWNQSVTRTRWLATKLATIGTASAATAGLLSWAVTAWAHHIDYAKDNHITPLVYGARGIVPIGYALFAFALGVTLGMLIRRTVPAMAATLVIYVTAVVSMPLSIRARLLPVSHATSALDISKIENFEIIGHGSGNATMKVVSGVIPDGAWVLTNNTITPTGQIFTGPPNPQFCGEDQGPRACMQWVGSLGLRQYVTYQPASHFWSLQWTETGVFVAVAVLLAGFCFWWTRRRLS
jgi:ABC-type transport system involved in multi-copper enzyme maturation permease subunit